jgi:hypothetical protein
LFVFVVNVRILLCVQVNSIAGEIYLTLLMVEHETQDTNVPMNEMNEDEEQKLYFSPIVGNVLFASAIDGWSFCTDDFAYIFAQKLNLDLKVC